jgi:hypothetical protein
MATLPTNTADAFHDSLGAVQRHIRAGVVSSRARAADHHWQRWETFCQQHSLDPLLLGLQDPIPALQVFATRYRSGEIAPGGQAVRSHTVEDALCAVGQGFASVGAQDSRKTATGDIDFRLQRQLHSWSREDDPPARVKPIPIQIILAILSIVFHATDPSTDAAKAIADMAVSAFFYLLRPGEYTGTATDDAAFRLQDLQFFIGDRFVDPCVAPISDMEAATSALLIFTNQKNGVRGEVVNHATSGASHCCPVRALARQTIHLRENDAPPTTPLSSYYHNGRRRAIRSVDITDALRAAARITGDELGNRPEDISARSIRAGGAMALLCAQVDSDLIKLLGRWQSDTMMRYLHVQARPVMRNFAARMLHGGDYNLVQNPQAQAPQNPQAPE